MSKTKKRILTKKIKKNLKKNVCFYLFLRFLFQRIVLACFFSFFLFLFCFSPSFSFSGSTNFFCFSDSTNAFFFFFLSLLLSLSFLFQRLNKFHFLLLLLLLSLSSRQLFHQLIVQQTHTTSSYSSLSSRVVHGLVCVTYIQQQQQTNI